VSINNLDQQDHQEHHQEGMRKAIEVTVNKENLHRVSSKRTMSLLNKKRKIQKLVIYFDQDLIIKFNFLHHNSVNLKMLKIESKEGQIA